MDVDECYHELGLDPGASDAEVKAAWRRLAARWHPDRNGSPEALRRIQRINQALEEIRRFRSEGGVATDGEPEPSDDGAMAHTIELAIEDIAAGCVRELRGDLVEDCVDCKGSGQQLHATACADCGGSGRVQQSLWVAWLSSSVACKACEGRGTTRPGCSACGASGKVGRPYHGQVQVPPGVRRGAVLETVVRLDGDRGEAGRPVRVRWTLQPHAIFTLADDGTVACELPADGFAWMADRWIDVPTPRGLQQMRLRRGVLNYRIRGAGLPWQQDGTPADCIVTVAPLFPETFSPEQDACIDRLVASNAGAKRTAAGQRMAGWNATLAAWQARTDEARP